MLKQIFKKRSKITIFFLGKSPFITKISNTVDFFGQEYKKNHVFFSALTGNQPWTFSSLITQALCYKSSKY